jgi:hypothetical protein
VFQLFLVLHSQHMRTKATDGNKSLDCPHAPHHRLATRRRRQAHPLVFLIQQTPQLLASECALALKHPLLLGDDRLTDYDEIKPD